jgi:2-hydroxychromene-2-carboxylate isomerase
MRLMASTFFRNSRRRRARVTRALGRTAPTVHYFHQVADPFSHLAVQKLDALLSRYDIALNCHLVPVTTAEFAGDAARFASWQQRDARDIAPFYDVDLPGDSLPDIAHVREVEKLLAGQNTAAGFAAVACDAGRQMWQGRKPEVVDIQPVSDTQADAALQQGVQLRDRLGHYYGAMFWFDGEWYWGVDRLCHLERRLVEEGYSRLPDEPLCVPRPTPPQPTTSDHSSITLEYFPSLRSPYTAISFRRTIQMVDRLNVNLVLKPVMPMMMRGVPAPARKGMYIMMDTAREARFYGDRFGRIVDPFGEPVRTAFSLYPWAAEQNHGRDYLQSYLDAAFADGIDVTSRAGMKHVVERTGLNWTEAIGVLDHPGDWEQIVDANVAEMLDEGLWGVPSFRVSGGTGEAPFSCWGQDRLWRDHQWIHIDPERAKAGPFGAPIAHGQLTLSVLSFLPGAEGLPNLDGMKMGINYGWNKVRFPSPVPVGAEIRTIGCIKSVAPKGGMLEVVNELTVEIKGQDKPACVAESVLRIVF